MKRTSHQVKTIDLKLQTDGYEAYDNFDDREGVIHLHCMVPARQYFVDALQTDKQRAEYALEQMQQLYAIERRCREEDMSFDKRKVLRQKEAVPILEHLGQWMKQEQANVLPKSPIGKAFTYCLKRWEKLCRYTDDGMLSIDNNSVEKSIRPVALGRKNCLVCGSAVAAQRTAAVYSLLGCCKLSVIDPYAWLKDVLARLLRIPSTKSKPPPASVGTTTRSTLRPQLTTCTCLWVYRVLGLRDIAQLFRELQQAAFCFGYLILYVHDVTVFGIN